MILKCAIDRFRKVPQAATVEVTYGSTESAEIRAPKIVQRKTSHSSLDRSRNVNFFDILHNKLGAGGSTLTSWSLRGECAL